jgi:hypothetical protein
MIGLGRRVLVIPENCDHFKDDVRAQKSEEQAWFAGKFHGLQVLRRHNSAPRESLHLFV